MGKQDLSREENIIARLIALDKAHTKILEEMASLNKMLKLCGTRKPAFKPKSLEASEKEVIQKTLNYCNGNQTRAAKMLGISRSTLYRKLFVIEG